MSAAKTTKKKSTASGGLSAEEKAALKETLAERKAAKSQVEGEKAVLTKVAAMPEPDRSMGRRLHAIVKENAPGLMPRLWYGMPAYARDGKVVCWFQAASKFKTRYGTFAFSEEAHLDDGDVWPTAFALGKLTPAEEAKIGALVRKAMR